ncbi:hypothetical protein MTR_2g102770 [Medicago truncatula]|uniref:Uncharacterized protein n=1 Tax=Medicago truncatula TaxID=3880 RepID=G7IMG4_MEDTR|nr:hypothetical protein MTR_2g102770 [Medicago truncatula]
MDNMIIIGNLEGSRLTVAPTDLIGDPPLSSNVCSDLTGWYKTNWRQGTRQKLIFLSLTKPQHNFLSHVQVV